MRRPFLTAQQAARIPSAAPMGAAVRQLDGREHFESNGYGEASTSQGCSAERVQLAGGALQTLIVHPSARPFEQLYRRLPEEGLFAPTVSPQRPFVGELGAFRVPDNFMLLLFDLRPDIYRFSGIDAGDYVPVQPRRFSSIVGFDLTIDGQHPDNVQFELDPAPIQRSSLQAYAPQPVTPPTTVTPQSAAAAFLLGLDQAPTPQSEFNLAAANSFADAAGAGTSLLPQRPTRYGALSAPFTLFVPSSKTIQIRFVAFRPMPSPIAFIEYDIAGVLVPKTWAVSLLECAKPVAETTGYRR